MRNKPTLVWLSILLALCVLAATAPAQAGGRHHAALPHGAWLLTVTFPVVDGAPPPPPPFIETLTLHFLGTVSESNTALNGASYNPALGQGCGFTGPGGALEFNCNASDGTGSWRRTGGRTLSFTVIKLLFDGETNAHVGYLRVSSRNVRFGRHGIEQDASDSLTEVLIGTDLDTAIAIPFGGADAVGTRIY